MSAIETDDGFYRRMAERAAARKMVADAEWHANNPPRPIHLHGTMTACVCGGETGITCVVIDEDYRTPNFCPECGKPSEKWGDTQPWREVSEHQVGCRVHPETGRCTACGEPMIGGAVSDLRGWYHFGCAPGAVAL